MPYSVYYIEINGIKRYIGHTNDLKRREKEHNQRCFKTENKKLLYHNIKNETGEKNIILKLIKIFTTKTEAKRYEALLILLDHFGEKNLWQKVPSISDR